MRKILFSYLLCIFYALASNAMDNQSPSEPGHLEMSFILKGFQRGFPGDESYDKAFNFVTTQIERLDYLSDDMLEIFCGIFVEIYKYLPQETLEEILLRMAQIANRDEHKYLEKIDYLLTGYPLHSSLIIKEVCLEMAICMYKYNSRPSINLINYITTEIIATHNAYYFQTLSVFYLKLLEDAHIQPLAAVALTQMTIEDDDEFKMTFLKDLEEKVGPKKISRRTAQIVSSDETKIKPAKRIEETQAKKKDNCIIS